MPIQIANSQHPIVARRLALGISRAKLAELALVSPFQLAHIEQGVRVQSPTESARIERALSTLEDAQARIRRDALATPPTPTPTHTQPLP